MRPRRQISRTLKLSICFLTLALAVVSTWNFLTSARLEPRAEPLSPQTPLVIAPNVPPDIPGGAPTATLQQAATFAWQEFIALNWRAQLVSSNSQAPSLRDTADTSKLFGDQGGPLVWQTYRGKVETFPGIPALGPHGSQSGPYKNIDYGYDDPPAYIYGNKSPIQSRSNVSPCSGQTAPAQPAWINLDEVTQIALDSMFAGIVPSPATPTNSQPQLIRFMAKANRTQYKYVVQNTYWYGSRNLQTAQANFKNFINGKTPTLQQPYVSFPTGTIETKAAWRQLAPGEDPGRFHMAPVRYYETNKGATCYREGQWALIALHIIQKTPSAPSFIFATFEQADNILTTNQAGQPVPVEDVDGNIINPPSSNSPTTPGLTYKDSPTNPLVSITGTSYCGNPGAQIYYTNSPTQTGLPSGGKICVNGRDNPIPPAIIAANKAAHDTMRAYNTKNGISQSPWLYYKLVNVQAYPFDRKDIDPTNPNGIHNPATYYQANIVVETNYTLQLFHGRVAGSGAPTDFPASATSPIPPPNVFVLSGGTPNSIKGSYNMGGCMGCHGNAQSAFGSDFSFILSQGPVKEAEHPKISSATLTRKYLAPLKKR